MDDLQPQPSTELNATPSDDLSQKQDKPHKSCKANKKKKKAAWWSWPLKAFFLTLVLSASFSLVSELLSKGGFVPIIIVIVVLLAISILFDAIGTAFASCDPTPFYSLASRKVRGAKTSLALLKKADVVSNICNDVIGDICGIMSGGAGAGIMLYLALTGTMETVISIVVSSLISALTVGGKALFKRLALNHAQGIVSFVGKICSVFSRDK